MSNSPLDLTQNGVWFNATRPNLYESIGEGWIENVYSLSKFLFRMPLPPKGKKMQFHIRNLLLNLEEKMPLDTKSIYSKN